MASLFTVEIGLKLQDADTQKVEEFIQEVLTDIRNNHIFKSEAIELRKVEKNSHVKFEETSYGRG